MISLSDFFGPDSPLRKLLPGFQPRAGQAWMAEAVAEAIADQDKLVVEAGTGTGKTFAYLLPALMSGRKTIISTGTKALQDQLYHRDLPLVGKAVGRPVTTALLKGRANYLCLQRLDSATEPHLAADRQPDLNEVREWRHRTRTGDRAELIDVTEDSSVWPLVTSTSDNCLGSHCPVYNDCFVAKARRAAQEADLVVVNHHLLLADLAMKEGGFVEFLPGADAIILDEAHQIPELAAQFFGTSVGSRELERLFDEFLGVTIPRHDPQLQKCLDDARTALRVLLADAPRQEGRHDFATVWPDISQSLHSLRAKLQDLLDAVGRVANAGVEIEKLQEQLFDAANRLALLASDDSWDGLRWLEVNPRSIRLNLTPLDVADTLNGMMNASRQAWIFTSATLAVGEDFSHFTDRMGLQGVTGLTFPSPYALEKHALIYLPRDLPAPSDSTHTDSVLAAVAPLLKLTTGGMFCLFTSHRALNTSRKWAKKNRRKLLGRPLLFQGDSPRDDLLRRFRELGNAVLFGTGSFWEGVDVRGGALTIVAIDKLPFASPADPMMMARLEFIRRQGGNGFTEHQLPQAALALKQGAGRLMRDQNDYGLVVLCDPRIQSKNYGKIFLRCLEPMQSTDSISVVKEFMRAHEEQPDLPGTVGRGA